MAVIGNSANCIQRIRIDKIWGHLNIDWKLDPQVNILAGINGSGKTTIFKIISDIFSGKPAVGKHYSSAYFEFSDENGDFQHNIPSQHIWRITNFTKINTFDSPVLNKGKITASNSPLDLELSELIDGNYYATNFIKLCLKLTNEELNYLRAGNESEAKATRMLITDFFSLINSFFAKTRKEITLTEDNNVVFQTPQGIILPNQLSAGEKQLLIIFFKFFLQEREHFITILDEPEISLHLEWQQNLIDAILKINPNAQLLIATHSPSIFGKGWGDKFINIQNITVR
jgi:predicted ATPase